MEKLENINKNNPQKGGNDGVSLMLSVTTESTHAPEEVRETNRIGWKWERYERNGGEREMETCEKTEKEKLGSVTCPPVREFHFPVRKCNEYC